MAYKPQKNTEKDIKRMRLMNKIILIAMAIILVGGVYVVVKHYTNDEVVQGK